MRTIITPDRRAGFREPHRRSPRPYLPRIHIGRVFVLFHKHATAGDTAAVVVLHIYNKTCTRSIQMVDE